MEPARELKAPREFEHYEVKFPMSPGHIALAGRLKLQSPWKSPGSRFATLPLDAIDESETSKHGESTTRKSTPGRMFCAITDFFSTTAVQTLMYMAFVGVFQMLTESLRLKEEFFLDKMIVDTFIENHFDSNHNSWESIRRIPDLWEWGNHVLWPGLCNSTRTRTWAF